jgi:hypothetical protein
LKNPSQNRTGGVAQGEGPEFKVKPQYHKKRKRKRGDNNTHHGNPQNH